MEPLADRESRAVLELENEKLDDGERTGVPVIAKLTVEFAETLAIERVGFALGERDPAIEMVIFELLVEFAEVVDETDTDRVARTIDTDADDVVVVLDETELDGREE